MVNGNIIYRILVYHGTYGRHVNNSVYIHLFMYIIQTWYWTWFGSRLITSFKRIIQTQHKENEWKFTPLTESDGVLVIVVVVIELASLFTHESIYVRNNVQVHWSAIQTQLNNTRELNAE